MPTMYLLCPVPCDVYAVCMCHAMMLCMCMYGTGTGYMALNSEIISMPTYQDYLQYAKAKGFIPFTEKTFNAFIKAKINPISPL